MTDRDDLIRLRRDMEEAFAAARAMEATDTTHMPEADAIAFRADYDLAVKKASAAHNAYYEALGSVGGQPDPQGDEK